MIKPSYSVVIPLYNKELSVENAVASVLAQTISDFELLVINDGSTDTSVEVLHSIKDPRINIIDKKNGGVSSARNMGIQLAKADYIAFLDADDEWEVDFLETIDNLRSDFTEASVYTTGFSCIIEKKVLNTFKVSKRGIINDFFKEVYYGPVMNSSSTCFKKEVVDIVGFFNPNIARGEDLDMWARLAREFKIAGDPALKVWYRLGAENRAMKKVPAPETLWLRFIPESVHVNKKRSELRYYKKHLHIQFIEYILAGKLSYARQLISANKSILPFWTYMFSPLKIQKRQILTKIKTLFN